MDYDSIAKAGSMLGSGAVIVMDDSTCMVRALERLSYFYFEESCGQCAPCREGTGWLYRVVHRIENGFGRMEDLALLDDVSDNIAGRTICALGDAAALPVKSFIKHFRAEFVHHIQHKRCLVQGDVEPKRSEEHTSELQSRLHLVCRLLLAKKKLPAERGRLNGPIRAPIARS